MTPATGPEPDTDPDTEDWTWEARHTATRATIAAYDQHAQGYRESTATLPESVRDRLAVLAERIGPGGRVLEIGSGPGRDAANLEGLGLSVRRTDVTSAFVELMRADGHVADVLDPLVDDLVDPERGGAPYDAVWASACLLHVERVDLPVVLTRLAEVTRPGGALSVSLKQGDGGAWSRHGSIDAPRRFVYWRSGPLRVVVEAAGWHVEEVAERDGRRGERWLELTATRRD